MTNDVRSNQLLGTTRIGRYAAVCLLGMFVCCGLFVSPATATPKGSSVEQRIEASKEKTKKNPNDARNWISLGVAYVQRAYESGDPTYYPLAENSFDEAEKRTKNSAELFSAKASLALARHQFRDARALSLKALAVNPTSFEAKLALFDATVELGAYDEAETQVEALIDQRAGVASLSRLSYSRQLRGDLVGAEAAMRSAVASSPDGSFERSVALGYLGEVLLERGQGAAAARSFRAALAINEASVVAAMGLASIYAEAGDVKKSNEILSALSDRAPTPAVFGMQADIARVTNNRNAERSANQLVDATVRLYEANGAVVDSEMAVLLADRGSGSKAAALTSAKKAYAERKTIFTSDAMAWALFQSGQPVEALSFAKLAVARKPANASVRWHAAAIFAANGDSASARTELAAATLNKWFSPTQRIAVSALTKKLGES